MSATPSWSNLWLDPPHLTSAGSDASLTGRGTIPRREIRRSLLLESQHRLRIAEKLVQFRQLELVFQQRRPAAPNPLGNPGEARPSLVRLAQVMMGDRPMSPEVD